MSDSQPSAASGAPFLVRFALACLLCIFATIAPAKAEAAREARVKLEEVQVALDEDVYELDARARIKLPDDARRAIESGLTLRVTYQIAIDRVRRYMVDAEVAALEQRYEVSYHALSQRYLVKNLNTGEQQDFGSLQAALDRVSDVRGVPLIDAALIAKGPQYEGRVRAVLDLDTAPAALGWLLFWADDWNAESDWSTWTLGR
jgi:hypothetical protein